VPGRMEVIGANGPIPVVVDYAHTPAGLEVALSTLRTIAGAGRLVCVFGCGGDRDRGKRAAMGEVAAARADVVIVTSDNPRSEDPLAIIDEIASTMGSIGDRVVIEPDRALAIRSAVDRAQPGDIVLVAGKGHETTQVVGDQTLPFDDRTHAAAALADRFGEGGS
jgi:UDP-N-acetylmuramoyl-L-alanyl-D-glutamate--2,6-diaminopimelate ligase